MYSALYLVETLSTLLGEDIFTIYNISKLDNIMTIEMVKYDRPKKVLIIGSNPSSKSPDNTPFHPETRTRKRIDKWFSNAPYQLEFVNLYDKPTPNNRALKNDEKAQAIGKACSLSLEYDFDVVIGCGRTVHDCLNKASLNYYYLEHPSGSNRFWNNPVDSNLHIARMFEWIYKQ